MLNGRRRSFVEPEQSIVSGKQILLVLRARWRLALAVLVTTLVLALVLPHLMIARYTAIASVVVGSEGDAIAGPSQATQVFSSLLATQVDILASDRTALRVVNSLNLDHNAQIQESWRRQTGGKGSLANWTADLLKNHMSLSLSRESGVINIAVTWTDPRVAALLANAFAQAYIDTTIDLKVQPAKQYAEWFDRRSQEAREDLEAKQKALSDFQQSTGMTATDEKFDIENARLAELSSQLTGIELQRQDSESHQNRASGDTESLPEVLQNPVIGGLKTDLAREEAKLKNIAVTVGTNHPSYRDTEAEIESLQVRIDQEVAKIVASLDTINRTNIQNERQISAALDAQKQLVLELKRQHDQADVLKSDVTIAQRNMEAITERLAQSSLESHLQQANVTVLNPAIEPLKPSSPNYGLSVRLGLLLGIVFGVCAAVFREMLNPLVRSSQDAATLLMIPVIAEISDRRRTLTGRLVNRTRKRLEVERHSLELQDRSAS